MSSSPGVNIAVLDGAAGLVVGTMLRVRVRVADAAGALRVMGGRSWRYKFLPIST